VFTIIGVSTRLLKFLPGGGLEGDRGRQIVESPPFPAPTGQQRQFGLGPVAKYGSAHAGPRIRHAGNPKNCIMKTSRNPPKRTAAPYLSNPDVDPTTLVTEFQGAVYQGLSHWPQSVQQVADQRLHEGVRELLKFHLSTIKPSPEVQQFIENLARQV
jgi:hypothetical protein